MLLYIRYVRTIVSDRIIQDLVIAFVYNLEYIVQYRSYLNISVSKL